MFHQESFLVGKPPHIQYRWEIHPTKTLFRPAYYEYFSNIIRKRDDEAIFNDHSDIVCFWSCLSTILFNTTQKQVILFAWPQKRCESKSGLWITNMAWADLQVYLPGKQVQRQKRDSFNQYLRISIHWRI